MPRPATHGLARSSLTLFGLLALTLLVISPPVEAEAPDKHGWLFHPLPEGFTMYMTFMGTGLYDLESPHPEIPSCSQQLCVGDYFFDEILGLDEAAKEDWYQQAVTIWSTRFGIDPDDPQWAGRVTAIPFYADPRNEIRAYSMAGTRIHRQGWEVLDGGWLLIVTDPEGVELGGEYAGFHVGPNTVFGRGKYLVRARTRHGRFLADIEIDYQARGPIGFAPGFPFVGNCEIISTTINGESVNWGLGQAQPSQVALLMPTGESKLSYRNILTYGAGGGFGEPFPN